MMRSKILEERRRRVSPEVRQRVALSFRIIDRIHEVLEEKGLKQKDLAQRLGKSEAEISKWMRGTHNFTIDTISAIEQALQAPIVEVYNHPSAAYGIENPSPIAAAEPEAPEYN
ncbi:MAG: helix-turn-helix transcriptional regulator [Bacteroidaceae bacterium]|nr:helix-turn-helix transcriptional regulator [Bacteroidaceae bacterium]